MAYFKTYPIHTFIIVLGLFLCYNCSSSKQYSPIDDFNTAKDIEAFVHRLTPQNKYFTVNQSLYFEHSNCRQVVQALGIKPWYKSDIDGNGYNDLLVHSRWQQTNYLAVLMVFPENQYALKMISDEGCNCARPTQTTQHTLIEFFHFDDTLYQKSWFNIMSFTRQFNQLPIHTIDPYRDTLVYKFGEVIEYHSTTTIQEVTSLHFKTLSCLGHCPIFEMRINQDQTATYHAIKDRLRKGKFKANIDQIEFRKLMGLLQYIQVKSLKDQYKRNDLTEPVTELIIHFRDGTTKKITDASYQGTRGLGQLYHLLIDLRKNQSWESIQ